MKVGFIGLGNMGSAMATNLKQASVDLHVYNRTREKAEKLGVPVAASAAALAAQVDVLITMLSNDQALKETMEGDTGALAGLKPGALHISMSTVSLSIVRELTHQHQEAGQAFLSAPVFGRPDAAANAKLVVVVGGSKSKAESVQSLFQHLGRAWHHVGEEPWKANLFKVAGNFWISSMIETIGESTTLVKKAGGNQEQFFEILTSLFQSPIYESYGRNILTENFEPAGFALKHGLKDVQLVADAARQFTVPMSFVSALRDNYTQAVNQGKADIDWSGLSKQIAENAGL